MAKKSLFWGIFGAVLTQGRFTMLITRHRIVWFQSGGVITFRNR